jgi:hypothetical protein
MRRPACREPINTIRPISIRPIRALIIRRWKADYYDGFLPTLAAVLRSRLTPSYPPPP